MNQIPLLTIREQPRKREPELSSRIIRQYVKDSLRGFMERQAERERVRAKRHEREAPRRPKHPTLFDMETK
jgi:hypothetical protein